MMSLDALLTSETVSLNHVWTTASPIFELNLPYDISPFVTHNGTLGSFPGGLTAASVSMQFSGQHGAPTIDALGHIGVNGTVFGGMQSTDIEGPEGLLSMGIDEYPEDKYLNRGVLIDIPFCKGVDILPESSIITDTDIIECAKTQGGLEIKEGDSVLIRTGYGSLFTDPVAYLTNWPGPSQEAAEYLAEMRIFLTGADNIGWDASNTPFPGHLTLIPMNGIYIVENLNLEGLSKACQANKQWEFALVVNPPKIKGAAAMALNAFAIFPQELPETSAGASIISLPVSLLKTIGMVAPLLLPLFYLY